jgi:hypothetical protein
MYIIFKKQWNVHEKSCNFRDLVNFTVIATPDYSVFYLAHLLNLVALLLRVKIFS